MIENDKKKQEYFLVSDDDESENEHVQRLEDGSKANVWSFNTQMKTDTKQADLNEDGEDASAPMTMHERV